MTIVGFIGDKWNIYIYICSYVQREWSLVDSTWGNKCGQQSRQSWRLIDGSGERVGERTRTLERIAGAESSGFNNRPSLDKACLVIPRAKSPDDAINTRTCGRSGARATAAFSLYTSTALIADRDCLSRRRTAKHPLSFSSGTARQQSMGIPHRRIVTKVKLMNDNIEVFSSLWVCCMGGGGWQNGLFWWCSPALEVFGGFGNLWFYFQLFLGVQ